MKVKLRLIAVWCRGGDHIYMYVCILSRLIISIVLYRVFLIIKQYIMSIIVNIFFLILRRWQRLSGAEPSFCNMERNLYNIFLHVINYYLATIIYH